MIRNAELVEQIRMWLDEFEEALENWESWLYQADEAYVLGNFPRLTELELNGSEIHKNLARLCKRREELIHSFQPHGSGTANASLTHIVSQSVSNYRTEWAKRFDRVQRQLERTQRKSTTLWFCCYQAFGYTNALLEILATGNSERATYGESERSSLEGGQIVDAAA